MRRLDLNQEIHILRRPYQILGASGVSRQHYGMTSKIDAVAQRRFDHLLINQERGNVESAWNVPTLRNLQHIGTSAWTIRPG